MKKILSFESNTIPHSVYNTRRAKRMSVSPGLIYPLDFRLYAPNSKVKESFVSKMFSEPTVSPVMGRFRWRTFTFACDLGNYNYDLDRNGIITNDQPLVSSDGVLNPGILSKFPQIKMFKVNATQYPERYSGNYNSRLVHPTSLHNYFHYPAYWYPVFNSSDTQEQYQYFSALPFICYYDVFRNYFVNRQQEFYPKQYNGTFSDPTNLNSKYTPRYSYKSVSSLDNFFKKLYQSPLGVNICSLSDCPLNVASGTDSLDKSEFNTPHSGFLHTTYMPDLNTAFISATRKLNISKNATFNVSGDQVAYEQILNASMLKRVLDKIDFTNGQTFDWIEATYGKRERAKIPILLNVNSDDLNFGDIMTTADTYNETIAGATGSPAGKRVGSGFMRGGNSGYQFNTGARFYAIITLGTLVPYVDYDQGFDEVNDPISLSDFPNPDLSNYSLQPRFKKYLREIYRLEGIDNPTPSDLADLTKKTTYGIGSNEVAGYQPPFTYFRTAINRVCGELTNLQRHWVLSRYYKWRNISNPEVQQTFDSTPYVYPEDWNYIFNDVEGRFDNFTMQSVINSKTILPISYTKLQKTI